MKNPNKSVLFISHEASRTGAPISLLNFILWFKENTDIPFYILLKAGGPLSSKFKSLGQVLFYNYYDFFPFLYSISKINYLNQIFKKCYLKLIKVSLKRKNIGLIYSNTITNGRLLNTLVKLHCPVITHVHEMEYLINRFGATNFNFTKKNTSKYITVSEAVKYNLIDNYNIPTKNITVVYNSIDFKSIAENNLNSNSNKSLITNELNIPKESFLVGASGSIQWLKGPDLFIQLAREVFTKKKGTPIHFIWIGAETNEQLLPKLNHDIKRLGIEKNIHFIGHKQNLFKYFAAFDVFTLVSREDSCPLVCLEAASLKTPILCFDKAGGAKEFVQNDCGFIIPYLDIPKMANRVIDLIESSKLRADMSNRAMKKVKESYDLNSGAKKIFNEIKKFI